MTRTTTGRCGLTVLGAVAPSALRAVGSVARTVRPSDVEGATRRSSRVMTMSSDDRPSWAYVSPYRVERLGDALDYAESRLRARVVRDDRVKGRMKALPPGNGGGE